MVALYPGYCEKFGWMLDESAVKTMTAKNAEKIKELDAKYVREPRAIRSRSRRNVFQEKISPCFVRGESKN